MKKILISLSTIAFVGVMAVGATGAFFSDTETSTGNTFTAGSIDLSLGADAISNADANGNNVVAMSTDNAGAAVFNFTDLKPGDHGTVAFGLNVESNDAYVCALSTVGGTPENTLIDPELPMDVDGLADGELQDYLKFATFDDDNENGIFDSGEPINTNTLTVPGFLSGDGKGFTPGEFTIMGWVPVADNTNGGLDTCW